MTERKCEHPGIVKESGGRATCPDRFARAFRQHGNCNSCNKVRDRRMPSIQPEGDRIAAQVINEAKGGGWWRT